MHDHQALCLNPNITINCCIFLLCIFLLVTLFGVVFSIKAAFSRSSINLTGGGTPTTPRHQLTPSIVVCDASPVSSSENSPILHRSHSSSPNDLRKQVLISQSSNQLRKNESAKSLLVLSSQVGGLSLLFRLLPSVAARLSCLVSLSYSICYLLSLLGCLVLSLSHFRLLPSVIARLPCLVSLSYFRLLPSATEAS